MSLPTTSLAVLTVIAVALVLGLDPAIALIGIAVAVLLLDAFDARILDSLLVTGTVEGVRGP